MTSGLPIPEAVHLAYASWRWEVAYTYNGQAVTHRLSSEKGEVRYLKLTQAGWWPSLAREQARMEWAADHLPVPQVVEAGTDGLVDWLITHALTGRPATTPALKSDPEALVRTLAKGLGLFHDAAAMECPFDFRLDAALALARQRLEDGAIDPERDFHTEYEHLSAEQAIRQLVDTRPATEDVVVCHGDYCLPNVLIEDGSVTGFVDLGELGVADRWWDLAVATWSVTWNLGPGHEQAFLEAYEIVPDPERIAFYRLLYDVVS
jgi:kanamycin kinase